MDKPERTPMSSWGMVCVGVLTNDEKTNKYFKIKPTHSFCRETRNSGVHNVNYRFTQCILPVAGVARLRGSLSSGHCQRLVALSYEEHCIQPEAQCNASAAT